MPSLEVNWNELTANLLEFECHVVRPGFLGLTRSRKLGWAHFRYRTLEQEDGSWIPTRPDFDRRSLKVGRYRCKNEGLELIQCWPQEHEETSQFAIWPGSQWRNSMWMYYLQCQNCGLEVGRRALSIGE